MTSGLDESSTTPHQRLERPDFGPPEVTVIETLPKVA